MGLARRPHAIPSLLAAAFLLLATLDLPYGYYTFLRIVVCGVSVYVAYCSHKWGKLWAAWVFGLVAILFNPLLPVHLTKDVWMPIDASTALLFVVTAATMRWQPQGVSKD